MKKIIVYSLLLLFCTAQVFAQSYDKHCYYGISFDISKNRNWGYGELIITDVEPFSPAEAAGIKVNDIIMEINGKATYLRDYATIASWLFDNPSPSVKFTIRNVNTYFKEYTLERQCITINSVDERFLSTFFSFYDLENNRQQNFTLPLKVAPTDSVDFTDYHTFGFYEDGSELTMIDESIRGMLERELLKKGLTRDNKNPDIWVGFFYDYSINPLFIKGQSTSGNTLSSLRFNLAANRMESMPIFDTSILNKKSNKTQYSNVVKLGFTFYERKYIDPTKYTQIWECSIEDCITSDLSLLEYAKIHVPLMMMQYPYSETKEKSDYYVFMNKYNYTGIHFDADQIGKVNDVDANSPAYEAGIRAGYIINKINGKSLDISKDQLSEGYRKFYEATEKYRDQNTKFVGIEGYDECMFWDKKHYGDIAKQFKKSEYFTAFSYLFDFAEYVNPNYNGTIMIEGWDGTQKRIFKVKPITRESVIIKTFPE